MKAIEIIKTGGPDVLELKNIELSDPKSGEVLIKTEIDERNVYNHSIKLKWIDIR